jgi:hypothetical protein
LGLPRRFRRLPSGRERSELLGAMLKTRSRSAELPSANVHTIDGRQSSSALDIRHVEFPELPMRAKRDRSAPAPARAPARAPSSGSASGVGFGLRVRAPASGVGLPALAPVRSGLRLLFRLHASSSNVSLSGLSTRSKPHVRRRGVHRRSTDARIATHFGLVGERVTPSNTRSALAGAAGGCKPNPPVFKVSWAWHQASAGDRA